MKINRNVAAKALIITALVSGGVGTATANAVTTKMQTNLTQRTPSATTKDTLQSTGGTGESQSVNGTSDTTQ